MASVLCQANQADLPYPWNCETVPWSVNTGYGDRYGVDHHAGVLV